MMDIIDWIILVGMLNARMDKVKSSMESVRMDAGLIQLDKDILDTMDRIISDVIHIKVELKKAIKAEASKDELTTVCEIARTIKAEASKLDQKIIREAILDD